MEVPMADVERSLARCTGAVLVLLSSVMFLGAAHALPIEAVIAVHDSTVHGSSPLSTNHEFWDDNKPPVVFGQVIALVGANPITGFTVRTRVTNNTSRDWASYVFSYEFAQHGDRHWDKEGYSPLLETQGQPVLSPIPRGRFLNSPTVYSTFAVPSLKKDLPDIPGRLRPALKSGAVDTFTQEFTIDQVPGNPGPGAFRGDALFEYLTSARATGLDIHWARRLSRGSSQFPDGLGIGRASRTGFQIVTKFDDPNPNNLPARNSGGPRQNSNVSVFPVLSKALGRQAEAAPESPGPSLRFDPVSGSLTITGAIINGLSLVNNPGDSRYASDPLLGAEIVVESLQLRLGLEGRTFYFGGGEVRVEKDSLVFLRGRLGEEFGFLATDVDASDGLLQNFGVLHDFVFVDGFLESPFLQDLARDLAGDAVTLDLAVRTLGVLPLFALIRDALEDGATVDVPVQVLIVPNGTIQETPEPAVGGLLLVVWMMWLASGPPWRARC